MEDIKCQMNTPQFIEKGADINSPTTSFKVCFNTCMSLLTEIEMEKLELPV